MRVLIADDDLNLRQGLVDLLKPEGFDCEAVADGASALHAFQRHRHAIVILDVVMPGLDGLSLCQRLRAEDPTVQIMLLSARAFEQDKVLGLELGADDYLGKPFSPRELIARLRVMGRRRKAPKTLDQPFDMGDITVDPGALHAMRGSVMIDLTPREVAFLSLLKREAGRALSRDEILDECWGREHNPNSRALDQYVSALRRKIERDPAEPSIILTARGRGYRFTEEI